MMGTGTPCGGSGMSATWRRERLHAVVTRASRIDALTGAPARPRAESRLPADGTEFRGAAPHTDGSAVTERTLPELGLVGIRSPVERWLRR
jgi:hypothetical protein